MSEDTVRTRIVIPKSLVEAIDELVGRGSRSRFLVEAVEKEIRRRKLLRAGEQAGGSLKSVEISGWETSDAAAEWVRSSRGGDQSR
jgi:metal-responsive CopG/Arc/MetJ family transcriptional regulator